MKVSLVSFNKIDEIEKSAIIIVLDEKHDFETIRSIAEKLYDKGCSTFFFYGKDDRNWHNTFDVVDYERNPNAEVGTVALTMEIDDIEDFWSSFLIMDRDDAATVIYDDPGDLFHEIVKTSWEKDNCWFAGRIIRGIDQKLGETMLNLERRTRAIEDPLFKKGVTVERPGQYKDLSISEHLYLAYSAVVIRERLGLSKSRDNLLDIYAEMYKQIRILKYVIVSIIGEVLLVEVWEEDNRLHYAWHEWDKEDSRVYDAVSDILPDTLYQRINSLPEDLEIETRELTMCPAYYELDLTYKDGTERCISWSTDESCSQELYDFRDFVGIVVGHEI